jgi:NAD(P)-binding Rossmann-like domain
MQSQSPCSRPRFSLEMRLCRLPHAAIRIARLGQPLRRPLSPSTRSFTSTHSPQYPPPITRIQSDLPPFEPQARPNPKAKNIAVVGGGVTGLASAYNLSKALPDARITLFEAKKKLGGWLESELIGVDDGEVLFEWGPRTLRNDGMGPGRYTGQLVGRTKQPVGLLHLH